MKFDAIKNISTRAKVVAAVIFVAVVLGYFSLFSTKAQLKSAVEQTLIDPGSVQYGDHVVSDDGSLACIEVNAKNRIGGYVGFKSVILDKEYGDWRVATESSLDCQSALESREQVISNYTQSSM